ncbi:TetR/AcrR family transcriptional regulator [Pseudomonas sp. F1_0610]|uniref:TetR/AcrR family transcriptional regulator n=1 Tax=Pseudomonas sp. F1_0610 TaxID=3114284 RepID=UPI0039C3217C
MGVDLIRDTAQVSKTSMYRLFGSKSSLIEAVLIKRHAQFVEGLTNIVVGTTKEKLKRLLDWHFEWFAQEHFRGCMFMHTLAEFNSSDELITQQALIHKLWLKHFIENSLEIPERNAELLLTFIEGLIVRAEFKQLSAVDSYYQAAESLAFS